VKKGLKREEEVLLSLIELRIQHMGQVSAVCVSLSAAVESTKHTAQKNTRTQICNSSPPPPPGPSDTHNVIYTKQQLLQGALIPPCAPFWYGVQHKRAKTSSLISESCYQRAASAKQQPPNFPDSLFSSADVLCHLHAAPGLGRPPFGYFCPSALRWICRALDLVMRSKSDDLTRDLFSFCSTNRSRVSIDLLQHIFLITFGVGSIVQWILNGIDPIFD